MPTHWWTTYMKDGKRANLYYYILYTSKSICNALINLQAKFKLQTVVIMVVFFFLTTPVGIAVGAGISNTYYENSPKALIIQGIFLAASSGILIYMALVDLLAADFMNSKVLSNLKLQLGTNLSLLVGVACMSLLAKWGESH